MEVKVKFVLVKRVMAFCCAIWLRRNNIYLIIKGYTLWQWTLLQCRKDKINQLSMRGKHWRGRCYTSFPSKDKPLPYGSAIKTFILKILLEIIWLSSLGVIICVLILCDWGGWWVNCNSGFFLKKICTEFIFTNFLQSPFFQLTYFLSTRWLQQYMLYHLTVTFQGYTAIKI